MKKSPALLALVVLSSLVFVHLCRAQEAIRISTSQMQTSVPTQQTQATNPHPEQPIGARDENEVTYLKELRNLFTPADVNVDEAKLIDGSTVQITRLAHIRWNAYVGAPEFVEPDTDRFPVGRELTVLDRRKGQGPIQQRHFTNLTTHNLIVAAVDSNAQLLWWTQIADPRVLRSEVPAPTGQLTGKTLHRASPEFFVEVPDDKGIKELRFYRVNWTGTEFTLEQISVVPF